MPVLWGDGPDARLLLALIKTHEIKFNYDVIARAMPDDVTAGAVYHRVHLLKAKARLGNSSNLPISSVPSTGGQIHSFDTPEGPVSAFLPTPLVPRFSTEPSDEVRKALGEDDPSIWPHPFALRFAALDRPALTVQPEPHPGVQNADTVQANSLSTLGPALPSDLVVSKQTQPDGVGAAGAPTSNYPGLQFGTSPAIGPDPSLFLPRTRYSGSRALHTGQFPAAWTYPALSSEPVASTFTGQTSLSSYQARALSAGEAQSHRSMSPHTNYPLVPPETSEFGYNPSLASSYIGSEEDTGPEATTTPMSGPLFSTELGNESTTIQHFHTEEAETDEQSEQAEESEEEERTYER